MNNIETNALRIAELMGYKPFGERIDGSPMGYTLNNSSWATCDIIPKFIDYNGLMPIVFECNTGDNSFAIRFDEDKVDLLRNNKWIEFDPSDGGLYRVDYEEEPIENFFIEALQLAVIKYLEIKNDE